MSESKTILPLLKIADLDRPTVAAIYDWLDALIDHRETEDTSCLDYMTGLQELQIELMNLLEENDGP